MNCIICRKAELSYNITSITFERDEFRLTINKVPAQVCPNCGEAIVDEDTATRLMRITEDVVDEGLFEEVREYRP